MSAVCKRIRKAQQNQRLAVDITKIGSCLSKSGEFFIWGEGVVAVGENCGRIRPTEKTKSRKGQHPQLPATKKKKTINPQFAIVATYHAHKDKDNREDRTD